MLPYAQTLIYGTIYVMNQKKSTVNKATKDILARCMATEDIIVEHRSDVPSAYFDTKNRVLGLPVWKDMDNSVYDMLVGHEVSHALHTPAEGWQDFVGKGKGSGIRHMFLNIVEDARIERLIKDKFPGIRRDFASAYKTLHTQDLFELNGRTITTDDELIDRLNLHFKVGLFGLENVPFTSEEKQYITRMAETKSFDDVVALAKELYEKHQDEHPDDEEDENGESQSGGESGEGEQNPFGDTPEDGEGSDTSQSTDGSGDDAESQSGDEDGESGEDSGQSSKDDTDDGESADSEDGKGSEGDSQGDSQELGYDDYKNNVDAAGSSQRAFEKAVQEMNSDETIDVKYHTLPNLDLSNILVDYSVIDGMYTNMISQLEEKRLEYRQDKMMESNTELQQFLNKAKSTVNHMVQQFQMKQAADADRRTNITKTGVLDTTAMIDYRWSEDIFLKNESHTDGKNHGIVMFLDWSGSMSNILKDTVEQLLILTEFCNKANVPYEVYAFSSNRYYPTLEGLDRWSDEYKEELKKIQSSSQYTIVNEDTDVKPHNFQLYNFLSSRMTSKEYKVALQNFWGLAGACSQYGSRSLFPSCLDLGCTPLNEAIISAFDIIPEFQRQNGIQIVNSVFLTDGDGHSMGIGNQWGYNKRNTYVRDHKTRRTYTVGDGNRPETDVLLEMLKDKTGCNTIGIRLEAKNHIRNYRYYKGIDDSMMSELAKSWKKHNFITLPSSYDKYFVVQGQLKVEFDALEELDEDASIVKIKNAFLKGNTSKKSSRVIANQMVEIIAT